MREYIAREQTTLIKSIQKAFPKLNYVTINRVLRKKDIKINGKRVNSDVVINKGDNVQVYIDFDKEDNVETIYQDSNVVVVNKPYGIEVVDESKREKDVTEKPVPVAVQQAPKTDAAEKQPSLTEKERVISKIKENMERYKETADRPPQTAEKPKAVKGIGLQGKIQQQQTSKAPTQQNVLSPAVQAALINKKERE